MPIKHIIQHLLNTDEKVIYLKKRIPNFDVTRIEVEEKCSYDMKFQALTVEYDRLNWFGKLGLNVSILENLGYSKTNGIVFCENWVESEENLIRKLLIHELVHLYDMEVRKMNLKVVDDLMKSELRAYDFCGQCDNFKTEDLKANCLSSWVFASLKTVQHNQVDGYNKKHIEDTYLKTRKELMKDLENNHGEFSK